MKHLISTAAVIAALVIVNGCKRSDTDESAKTETSAITDAKADGSTLDDPAHDEVSLGKVAIGDMRVKLAQGHGAVVAGEEGHLVVKLPYSDNGATLVRAWIGTADRTLSSVGKGEYEPSRDNYDAHATAPDPLPADALWWIEVEKPDGTKVVGSAKLLRD